MKDIQCIELIVSKLSRKGLGTPRSPIRVITEVFTKDGELIAENDPTPDDKFVGMDLVHFARFIGAAATIEDVDKWLKSISNGK